MITFDPTVTFGAGAIVGVLTTKIIDHFLAKSRTEEDRRIKGFNDAARSFKEAFEPEFISSQSSQAFMCSYYLILKEAFRRHESAVIAFQSHLSKKELIRFERAWEEYCYPEGDPHNAPEPLIDYFSEGDESIDYAKRQLAFRKINNILKFAAPK